MADRLYVRKSNDFVTAKFKTSLLGNKIIALSLTKLEEEGNQVKAVLYPAELRHILSMYEDQNVYKKLKNISRNLAGNVITVEDGKGNFKTFSMCTNAEYIDQKLTLYYNKEMKPFITRLKTNYTTYELATLVNFKKNYTYRLYELLKKEAWKINKSKNGYTSICYNLNELKAMIGLVNTEATYIQKAIASNKYTWDQIVEEIAKPEDKQHDRFTDFKTRVLEEAKKEMKNSDIGFTYSLEKGAKGKVVAVHFIISYNIPSEETSGRIKKTAKTIKEINPEFVRQEEEYYKDAEIESEELIRKGQVSVEAYDEMVQYLKAHGKKSVRGFTVDYYTTLLDLADGNPEIIKAQIKYGQTVKNIENYFGWLMAAVKKRYSENVMPYADGEDLEPIDEDEGLVSDMWKRIKAKDRFEEFQKKAKMSIEDMEEIYSKKELIDMYTAFIRNEK